MAHRVPHHHHHHQHQSSLTAQQLAALAASNSNSDTTAAGGGGYPNPYGRPQQHGTNSPSPQHLPSSSGDAGQQQIQAMHAALQLQHLQLQVQAEQLRLHQLQYAVSGGASTAGGYHHPHTMFPPPMPPGHGYGGGAPGGYGFPQPPNFFGGGFGGPMSGGFAPPLASSGGPAPFVPVHNPQQAFGNGNTTTTGGPSPTAPAAGAPVSSSARAPGANNKLPLDQSATTATAAFGHGGDNAPSSTGAPATTHGSVSVSVGATAAADDASSTDAQRQPAVHPDERRQLIVKFLTEETTEAELRRLFARVGPVEHVRIICDRVSGKTKGYGFVDYAASADAATAVKRMRGYPLCGKRLKVSFVATARRDADGADDLGDNDAIAPSPPTPAGAVGDATARGSVACAVDRHSVEASPWGLPTAVATPLNAAAASGSGPGARQPLDGSLAEADAMEFDALLRQTAAATTATTNTATNNVMGTTAIGGGDGDDDDDDDRAEGRGGRRSTGGGGGDSDEQKSGSSSGTGGSGDRAHLAGRAGSSAKGGKHSNNGSEPTASGSNTGSGNGSNSSGDDREAHGVGNESSSPSSGENNSVPTAAAAASNKTSSTPSSARMFVAHSSRR